jgi:hypothetical protein
MVDITILYSSNTPPFTSVWLSISFQFFGDYQVELEVTPTQVAFIANVVDFAFYLKRKNQIKELNFYFDFSTQKFHRTVKHISPFTFVCLSILLSFSVDLNYQVELEVTPTQVAFIANVVDFAFYLKWKKSNQRTQFVF